MYQYSGYLMGLIQLCNALAPVDRAAWQDIVQQIILPRSWRADWNANNPIGRLASMEDGGAGVRLL